MKMNSTTKTAKKQKVVTIDPRAMKSLYEFADDKQNVLFVWMVRPLLTIALKRK